MRIGYGIWPQSLFESLLLLGFPYIAIQARPNESRWLGGHCDITEGDMRDPSGSTYPNAKYIPQVMITIPNKRCSTFGYFGPLRDRPQRHLTYPGSFEQLTASTGPDLHPASRLSHSSCGRSYEVNPLDAPSLSKKTSRMPDRRKAANLHRDCLLAVMMQRFSVDPG